MVHQVKISDLILPKSGFLNICLKLHCEMIRGYSNNARYLFGLVKTPPQSVIW